MVGAAACAFVFALGWRLLLIGLAARRRGDIWNP
jgi:hypothetical protein